MIARSFTLISCSLALVTSLAMGAESKKDDGRARVFVLESDSWTMGGEFDIFGDGAGDVSGGARPQTAEIVKTLRDRCPTLVVTRKEERADYVLDLQHEGGKVFLRKNNKFAVYNADGDAIESGSTRSLGNAVKEACVAMADDWHEVQIAER